MEAGPFQGIAALAAPPLLVATALAVVGPFGTFYDLPLGQRALYWGAIVGLNWLQVELAVWALRRWRPLPPVWLAVAAGAAAAVPATAEVHVLESLLRPWLPLPPLPLLYLWVLVLTVAIAAPVLMLRQRTAPPVVAAKEEPPRPRPCERLPPALGDRILCLQAEDHYVRVHTEHGDALLLLRMADAERELAGVAGLRVHRSWWVAHHAVDRATRQGGRWMLELVNGLRVPVSRTRQAAAKQAGLLR